MQLMKQKLPDVKNRQQRAMGPDIRETRMKSLHGFSSFLSGGSFWTTPRGKPSRAWRLH